LNKEEEEEEEGKKKLLPIHLFSFLELYSGFSVQSPPTPRAKYPGCLVKI